MMTGGNRHTISRKAFLLHDDTGPYLISDDRQHR